MNGLQGSPTKFGVDQTITLDFNFRQAGQGVETWGIWADHLSVTPQGLVEKQDIEYFRPCRESSFANKVYPESMIRQLLQLSDQGILIC